MGLVRVILGVGPLVGTFGVLLVTLCDELVCGSLDVGLVLCTVVVVDDAVEMLLH